MSCKMQKFVCKCFYTHNYFIEKFNLHLVYNGDGVIDGNTKRALQQKGASDNDLNEVLEILRNERSRREKLDENVGRRCLEISQRYTKLHPHVYNIQREFFDPRFLEIVKYCKTSNPERSKVISMLSETKCSQVWALPVFTDKFCEDFVKEVKHFEGSKCEKGRPNTVNNYGILLNELGFDETFFDEFREDYITPITSILYPQWGGGGLDSHKIFTVKYKYGEDLDLAYHYDNAEVTLNICLGEDFTGGELYFGGMRTEAIDLLQTKPVLHRKGFGIFHRGQHLHGAMKIGESSERHNLIIWLRSSARRNHLCPMCNRAPELVPQDNISDGFTKEVSMCGVN